MTRCFVPRCFDVNCLLARCLNAPWKSFYITYRLNDWRLKAHLQSRCYSRLIAWCRRMHPIRVKQTAWLLLLNSRNPGRGCWSLRSKAAFLENYLAVSTWILNGSSIECHEKKHQPFSLSGVLFGSRRFYFLGENRLRAGAVKNELSTLVSLL